MIHFMHGDIFDSKAEALVNPVNLQGVMGKGLALEFKKRFPENYIDYVRACTFKEIGIGKLLVFQENGKYIINFPTKDHWTKPSKLEYITLGLDDLEFKLITYGIKSVAIPKLGCGLGGLNWDRVLGEIIHVFKYSTPDVYVYE